jgi:hypothetical protein
VKSTGKRVFKPEIGSNSAKITDYFNSSKSNEYNGYSHFFRLKRQNGAEIVQAQS